jgi:predicted AAA+ superfamily ATPase
MVQNTALISAQQPEHFDEFRAAPDRWGRVVESAVGAHLVNRSKQGGLSVFYWRAGNDEADFVITYRGKVIALEVKSGRADKSPGMDKFLKQFSPDKSLLIGPRGLPWQEFLEMDPADVF